MTATIRREGSGLTVDATGQGKAPLVPESEAAFMVRIVGARITFERDEGGSVVGLRIEQRGTTVTARRMR